MSYFKKFTDFCAGVAAFVAALFVLRQYMMFTPPDTEEDAASKLSQFIGVSTTDYLMVISMIALLIVSVIIGIIFRKLPYVCLIFSIVPAVYICFMFESNILYEQKALFLLTAALHVIGNIAECIFRDKDDGGHRMFIASKLSYLMGALICFYMVKQLTQEKPKTLEGLNTFEKRVFSYNGEFDIDIISTLGWMLLIFLVISVLLYNVYFIDAILSLISLGYVIVNVTLEKLTFLPLVFLCIAVICTTSNILLAVFENNLSKKEQRSST